MQCKNNKNNNNRKTYRYRNLIYYKEGQIDALKMKFCMTPAPEPVLLYLIGQDRPAT